MKKFLAVLMAVMMLASFAACSDNGGSNPNNSQNPTNTQSGENKKDAPINVISREDGSGTRGAFTELVGLEVDGEDKTTANAEFLQSTSVVMSTVAGNENAIGYISLGSLNDTVKAIAVDGVEPTVANIENGSYSLYRPFNIVTGATVTPVAQDFINYILSADGQKIVSDNGYISSVKDAPAYTASNMSGQIVLSGSTSVAPLMEKIAEAYKAVNAGVTIQIQQSGSGAGISDAIAGVVDIGMASRSLKAEELSQGVTETKIALDGIAVIVNNANAVTSVTKEQLAKIYMGELTNWGELN